MMLLQKPGKLGIALLLMILLVLPLPGAAIDPTLQTEKVRAYTRPLEFDYVSWTAGALWGKMKQLSLSAEHYLEAEDARDLILEYLELRDEIHRLQEQLKNTLADPETEDSEADAADIRTKLARKRSRREDLAPLIQEIMQRQINTGLQDLNLTWGGQAVPPVLYQAEPDSYALIVSPRDVIRQEANIMLVSGLTLDQRIALEEEIENNLDLSALVVGIGGVGLYPAMVIETGNLNWMLEVIGHEWTHNYLTLRPLGLNYFSSPELQTINETVAELAGEEIQRAVLQRYYPDRLPPEDRAPRQAPPSEEKSPWEQLRGELPSSRLDFRFEMFITRLTVDRLLRQGKIAEAEQYMEQRREFFWEHGYLIRKLNQAYFAFHGSYAAHPGGAVGSEANLLGQNLRQLEENMPSFASFLKKVSWMWRLEQFQATFEAQLRN